MSNFWLPEIASAHGGAIDQVIVFVHWFMLILFVGWMTFFTVALLRFRKGKNPVPDYRGVTSHRNTYLEVGVVVVEAVLLIGFSIPLWADRVDDFPAESESTVVRVVAQQFAWNVHYPGPDGVFGKTDVKLVDEASNPVGLDRSDPAAKDDVTTVNQMRVPVDKPVIVQLSSKDVIHSFGVPEFRVKQDAIPGLEIPLWWKPTVTTEEMRRRAGHAEDWTYEIACAQLCGIGHSTMRGFVFVDTPEAFQTWMDGQVAAQQSAGDEDDIWN
jgi:cytochrome c oxidase subunit 2